MVNNWDYIEWKQGKNWVYGWKYWQEMKWKYGRDWIANIKETWNEVFMQMELN